MKPGLNIKRCNALILILIGMIILCSCNKKYTIEEYQEYCTTSEVYVKTNLTDNFFVNCNYRTSEFLAINEIKKQNFRNDKINLNNINEKAESFDNSYYFDIKIGSLDNQNIVTNIINTQEDYSILINYLTYNIQNDFYILKENSDTIKPIICNYYNTYGMGKTIDLTVAFQKQQSECFKNFKLIYKDKFLGIKNDLVFEYDLSELQKEIKLIN